MASFAQGLSAAAYGAGETFAKQSLMQAQSEQEMQRAMRLAEFKEQLEQRSREAQASRVSSKVGELADQQVGEKRGLIHANIADPSAWTPQQQAAVDQSLAQERKQLANDPDLVLKAAAQTGDLNMKEQALMAREDKRLDAAERVAARNEVLAREREDRRDERTVLAETARDERHTRSLTAADERLTRQITAAEKRAEEKAAIKKPLPQAVAKALLENQANLRMAQKALALASGQTVDDVQGDAQATGWKGFLPNQVLNRVDPSGVNTRAAIADLGSMVIHDRSGAAVTAAEFPRLAPFIPTEKDDADTVKKKLGLFVKNYQAIIDDTKSFFEESGYKVPTQVLKSSGAPDAKSAKADIPRISTPDEAARLPSGSLFVGPDGKTRRVP